MSTLGPAPAGLSRRSLLAAAALAGSGATGAAEPADRAAQTLERWRALAASAPAGPALDPARTVEREALLASGERRLAAGDADGALRDFDVAAQKLHAADTEMSLVRAWMQQGEYRRAIAFVAHTAQAHRQVAGGAVLYAWLLSRGAQDAQALRLLDGAGGIEPGSPFVARVRELIGPSASVPEGALLAPPLRLAPYATGASPPRSAQVVASSVLLDDGRHALAPGVAVRGARRLWLRNGLGQTVAVRSVVRASGNDRHARVAVLELAGALPVDAAPVAPRDPFPGSAGSVIVHRADALAKPAWPRLYAGFHGMPDDDGALGMRRLGIDVPPASSGPHSMHGGPVYDAAGRWAGIAVAHADGAPRAVMRSALASLWPGLVGEPAMAASTSGGLAHAPFDEVYERALRTGLQLIAQA